MKNGNAAKVVIFQKSKYVNNNFSFNYLGIYGGLMAFSTT